MKKIRVVAVKDQLIKYAGDLYQTNHLKILLCFYNGSETWQGMFPGMDFDEYYDETMLLLGPEKINPDILKERRTYPTFIYPAKQIGICQKEACSQPSDFKYCSLYCWYNNSLEINQFAIDNAETFSEQKEALDFRIKLIEQFGKIAEGSTPRVSEADGLLIV